MSWLCGQGQATAQERMNNMDRRTLDSQEKWVRDLTQLEINVLAKGLSFAISPEQLIIANLITAINSAIQQANKLAEKQNNQDEGISSTPQSQNTFF